MVEERRFENINLYKDKFGGVWIKSESDDSAKTLTPYAIEIAEKIENDSNKKSLSSEQFGYEGLEVYKSEGDVYIKFGGEERCLENPDEIAKAIRDLHDYA